MLKRRGDRGHPCLKPVRMSNQPDSVPCAVTLALLPLLLLLLFYFIGFGNTCQIRKTKLSKMMDIIYQKLKLHYGYY